ncbi:hypothetical protein [Polynucleobacter sp. HIN5]|uniref:hypothetical protein n=1 Tax=Polynucleobacter sp. HIN5 TaxID=3047864 RepID=UPI0025723272|nr:hypothetical protein [Polynucleobacter sp. HIN5]BEI33034.1 hypothetical protein PHIN5_04020 [Polynucleobacter sp. HIN5]
MNPSEPNNTNSVDQEKEEDQFSSQLKAEIKSEPKPTMSKREIMEELSRQRFPWEE